MKKSLNKFHPELENKPLVEAIFELRWDLKPIAAGMPPTDPHYKIFLGRFYDRIIKDYPFYEKLPAADVPDMLAGHTVQHRFRLNQHEWPLVQTGPGLVTLNDTQNYTWNDFEKRAKKIISIIFKAYPKPKELKFFSILLRYIDAMKFDYEEGNILEFLATQMKTKIQFNLQFFKNTGIKDLPIGFDMKFAFFSTKPKGAMNIIFKRGKFSNEDALIWETSVKSIENDIPRTSKGIESWLTRAHDLSDDWFFKTIDGELFERFK